MRRVAFYLALGFFAAVLIDWALIPHVVFLNEDANWIAVGIALLMPIPMAIAGPPFAIRQRAVRISARVALWLGAAISALPAPFCLNRTPVVPTAYVSPAKLLSTGRYTIAVRRIGGSPWGSDKIDVDQVCPIMPGLVLAKWIHWQPASDTTVRVVDRDHVQLGVATVTLRPLLAPFC